MLCDFNITECSDGTFFYKCKRGGCSVEATLKQRIPDLRSQCDVKDTEELAEDKATIVSARLGADSLGITWDDAKHYAAALAKWTRAGFPKRSQEEVERIELICRACEHYIGGRCNLCGCRVNLGPAITNKIRMATENCQKDKWNAAVVDAAPKVSRVEKRRRAMARVAARRPITGGRFAKMAGFVVTTRHVVTSMVPPIPGKIDVVYPLSDKSRWSNNELRYSLRSLEKNFPDLGRVFVVGCKPAWLTGVVHIAMEDVHKHNKDANLIDKVLTACQSGLSDQFVFMSDDQIFLTPTRFSDMKPLHYGDLKTKPDSFWGGGSWKNRLKATRDTLDANSLSTLNYESHCPTPYDRLRFVEAAGRFPYRDGNGFTINTLICNTASVVGEPVGAKKATYESAEKDADKIRRSFKGKQYLGYSDDGLTDAFKSVLQEAFPTPSRFESVVYPISRAAPMSLDTDLVRRINLVGSDNVAMFGGWYDGAYFLQQVPEEAAEFITLAKQYLSHPRLLEVGSAAGGFAKLLDDELVCRSVSVIDNNAHPQHHWRPARLPHAAEYVGDAANSADWLAAQKTKYDLIVVDTDHVFEHEKEHVNTVLPYLEDGGLLVFHDSITCKFGVGKLVTELKGGLHHELRFVAEIGSKLGIAVFQKHGVQPACVYTPPPATLLFHFAPHLARPQVIDFHIRCLGRYLHQFNKVQINIATGNGFERPEIIEDRLRPFIATDNVEFFHTPNTRDGEVTPFFTKLLPSVGSDENVCYGHSKGAMLSGMPGGLAWAELMYAHTMQNSRSAAAILKTHDCLGSFQRIKDHRGAHWHYAGTFFWFRNVQKYVGYLNHISNRYAVEQWLGRFVPPERAWNNHGWPFLRGVARNKGGLLDKYASLPW